VIEQVVNRDRIRTFTGIIGEILLDVAIQIEFPFVAELKDKDGREELRDRRDFVARVRVGRNVEGAVCQTETPGVFPVGVFLNENRPG
jgi:hypothetical protein